MIEENNCCVICGAIIPEGTMICPKCNESLKDHKQIKHKSEHIKKDRKVK